MTTFRAALCIAFTTTLCGQGFEQGSGGSIAGAGVFDIGRSGTEALKPRWFGTLSALYDPSLTPYGLGADGKPLHDKTAGFQVAFGAYGRKDLKRSSFGWNYQGDYAHYEPRTQLDGTTHNVSLGYSNRFAKRATFNFQAGAGTSNRVQGVNTVVSQAAFETEALGLPTSELFDSRFNFVNGVASLKYAQTNRISYEFGGSGFIVDRKTKALAGVKSYSALSRVTYRINKRAQWGGGYTFKHFEFPRAFGASDINQGYVRYDATIGRQWTLALEGGVFRVESLGLQQVTVDPIIAAIIGRSGGIEAFYRINYSDSESISIGRSFRRSNFSVTANRGISPGNGLILTSRSTTFGASYTNTVDRWHFTGAANYASYDSLTRAIPKYSGVSAGVGANRALGRNLHFTSRLDYRFFQQGALEIVRRNGSRVSVGIGYSPGETPLATF